MLDLTSPADAATADAATADVATAGRRRHGTDGIPAASEVTEPSQNCISSLIQYKCRRSPQQSLPSCTWV